jgi:hypothetical protein
MAARKLAVRHQEDIKSKIQGSQLRNLLEEHALTGFYNGVEVSATRIDAAKFLLNKLVSNAPTQTEVSGPDGGAIPVSVNVNFS